MPTWIKITFDIAIGRASPRLLPASQSALLEAAGLYGLVSALDAALVIDAAHALAFGIADLVFTGLATAFCLFVGRRLHRFAQTLLAMLGAGAWLTLPSIALNGCWWLTSATIEPHHAPFWVTLPLAGILVWSILTVSRILREALDVDFFTALTVAMTYFLLDYLVLTALPARLFS